jgi:hypothetical protein
MKSIIIRSAVILGLGIAPGAVLAQSDSTQQPGAQSGTGPATAQNGAQRPQSGTMPKDAQGGMTAGSGSGTATESGAQAEGGNSGTTGTQTQPGAADSGQQQGTGSAAGNQQQSGEGMNQGSAQTQQGQSTDKTAQPEGGVSGETTGSIDVTTEQRTEIRQIITEEKVEPVASADFEVTVGTAVPQTVEVHTLPPRIVELVPAYEGYKYFVLADGRIVIVDPDSMEIVYIITA